MRMIENVEADQRLNTLLDEVELGETIVIMRRGKPVARLVPETGKASGSREEAIAAIRAFRKTLPRFSLDEIKSSIEEGRRY